MFRIQRTPQKEIKEIRSSLKLAQTNYANSKQVIFQQLSCFEKRCLVYLLEKYYFQNLTKYAFKSHLKKLYNLWRKQRILNPKCIINLSYKKLTLQEEEVFRFGLDHNIFPGKLDLASLKLYAKRLFSNIKQKLKIPFSMMTQKTKLNICFKNLR